MSTLSQCIVCYETSCPNQKPVTKQCRHARNVCSGCLVKMIEIAVERGGWDNLRCPDPKCRKKLAYKDIR